jgi:hypothetical protein
MIGLHYIGHGEERKMTLWRKKQISEKVNQEMTEPIKKVEFAPGCFDTFDGTQEELDALMAEIQEMFLTMTPEELEAQSREVTEESLEDMTQEEVDALIRQLEGDHGLKRNLQ